MSVILIPVLLTSFVVNFLELKRSFFLVVFYFVTFVFLYLDVFTTYYIDELYFAFNQFYYPYSTPVLSTFIGIFVITAIYNVFELYRAYYKTSGIIHSQIKYLMWIFIIGFSGGITSFLPAYGINIYPAWNATITISMLLITYIIFKHHFMENHWRRRSSHHWLGSDLVSKTLAFYYG